MNGTAELGLRERKKAATRQALHEAALRLAVAHGADKITVEAVADEAGVSRRTFSNYFANKEEALLHGEQRRVATVIDLVRGRPADEDAWTALSRAADEYYEQLGELDPQWMAQLRLLRNQPTLLAQQVNMFATMERGIAAAVEPRIGGAGAELSARLMAGTFMTATRVAMHFWLERPEESSLRALAQRTLAETGRGFLRA
jgi:AcrR family transcriptional regulator